MSVNFTPGGYHRVNGRLRRVGQSRMVPLARLERARLATIDFESIASTIPPQGQILRPVRAA